MDVDAKTGETTRETTLRAHLDSPVTANLAAQTIALEKFTGSLERANSQMPMKQLKLPLAGSLRADLGRQTVALELGTQFDGSKIATKLNLTKFAPLALAFDLDIDRLNLDEYLPPAPATEDKATKPSKLDFSALRGLDVKGTIHIGSLQVAKLELAKLDARLGIAGGRFDIAPLSLNLYEGSAIS